MPAYNASLPAQALYPGDSVAIVNSAATDTGITTTQRFAVGPPLTGGGITAMIVNTTNQTATGQYAATDTAANYQPLSGCTIPAGSALPYNLTTGWMRFTFSSAPTSGSLIVSR